MVTLVTVIHIIVCLFLILVILLQAGKGGGMGAAFGGAGSQTVFGGRGAATFLSKVTSVMAFLFVFTSMILAYWASQQEDKTLRKRGATKGQKKEDKKGMGTPTKQALPRLPPPKAVQVKVPPKAEPKAVEKAEPRAVEKAEPKAVEKAAPKKVAPKAKPAPKKAAPAGEAEPAPKKAAPAEGEPTPAEE